MRHPSDDIIAEKSVYGLRIPVKKLLRQAGKPYMEPAAEHLGLSTQTLAKWQHDAHSIKLLEAVKFAKYLKMTLPELLAKCEVSEAKVREWMLEKYL